MSTISVARRRIETISKIRKVTETMKLIAASKSVRIKPHFFALTEFQKEMYQIIPFINIKPVKTETKKVLWITFTSTMGMAGSYNLNIYRAILKNINKDDQVVCFGEKGANFFSKKNLLLNSYSVNDSAIHFFHTKYSSDHIAQLYLKGKFSQIKMMYTKYNCKNETIELVNILPIDEKLIDSKKTKDESYVYEPSKEEIGKTILSLYVESLIHAALVESKLAEHTSRLNAMNNANNNIDDILGTLHIQYNKLRQEKITKEVRK
ncbi:MAG: F0F1 ATP synthase subunit gamma [Mycoplasmoidaceae bacterium]|nr:MAG: F0F1 ATP synthase subunit gamma [Mycoplasmoidaceae bacterium]